MSVHTPDRLAMGDSPERAMAKETLWRLSALTCGHPTQEFYEAVVSRHFHDAFDAAWAQVVGQGWPVVDVSPNFEDFEAGYISAFLHGRNGKPLASLLAGENEDILSGLTRPVFMLNIAAFYKHFGLKPSTLDEGRHDEPDHLASMLEFMAVLCHLEAHALKGGRDPSPYRRAQRDFLCRYLGPTLGAVAGQLRRAALPNFDQTIFTLLQDMDRWSHLQVRELEARVGPFNDPDATQPAHRAAPVSRSAPQNLWG